MLVLFTFYLNVKVFGLQLPIQHLETMNIYAEVYMYIINLKNEQKQAPFNLDIENSNIYGPGNEI